MDELDKRLLIFLTNNLGKILTFFASVITLISSVDILWLTATNYIKSKLYYIDFRLFQVSFDIYQFALLTLSLFIIYAIFKSLGITIAYLWKYFKRKENIKPPIWAIALTFIFLLTVIIAFFKFCFFALYLIFDVIIFGGIIALLFWWFYKVVKSDCEEVSLYDYKKELRNIFYLLACLFFVEFLLCLGAATYTFLHKTDYYILETEVQDEVEVVIETYNDYYITKKARISEDNRLIIQKDSQRIHSTNDGLAWHKIFDVVEYE